MSTVTFPGQAAAPDGPVDMFMMYAIHHAFRRDLDDFVAAATHTPLTDRPTWVALRDRWGHFAHELHGHHSKEDDVLWPLLESRTTAAGDVEATQVLAEMEAEHAVIDPLLASVVTALDTLARTADPDARGTLTDDLVELRTALTDHLAHEERDAIAIVQRHVTPAEYGEVEKRFRESVTPRQAAFMVPWLYKGTEGAVREHVDAHAPLPFRVIHRLVRRGFARREASAFAHVPASTEVRR